MNSIRNIAIIAHVDHGKTTLVDKIIQSCLNENVKKENKELILDNNDLEREREALQFYLKIFLLHIKTQKLI